jgi:hypothetical protein
LTGRFSLDAVDSGGLSILSGCGASFILLGLK